jgi:hypothetical protein
MAKSNCTSQKCHLKHNVCCAWTVEKFSVWLVWLGRGTLRSSAHFQQLRMQDRVYGEYEGRGSGGESIIGQHGSKRKRCCISMGCVFFLGVCNAVLLGTVLSLCSVEWNRYCESWIRNDEARVVVACRLTDANPELSGGTKKTTNWRLLSSGMWRHVVCWALLTFRAERESNQKKRNQHCV